MNKGFTLIEFIITLAIIGIMAAILVPHVLSRLECRREGKPVPDSVKSYHLTELFSVEGCKVFSFYHDFSTHRLVICPAGKVGQILPEKEEK